MPLARNPEISPQQSMFPDMEYSQAVALTLGIARTIRRQKKQLVSPYEERQITSIAGCDPSGQYEVVAKWGTEIDELKAGLEEPSQQRVNALTNPIYLNFLRSTAYGYASVGVLIDENNAIVDENGLPTHEQTFVPIYGSAIAFEAVARRSLKESITNVRARAEIRSAGRQPQFKEPVKTSIVSPEGFINKIETPHKTPRRTFLAALEHHDLLPTWQLEVARDTLVSFSRPFGLAHEDGSRPAFMAYGSEANSIDSKRFASIVYMDPAGAWRQIVELRAGMEDSWYSINNKFRGITLPYQLQQVLSKELRTIPPTISHEESQKLIRGAIKSRSGAENDAWRNSVSHLESVGNETDSCLEGNYAPNFNVRKDHYTQQMPEFNKRVMCEIYPSFNGMCYYTFARASGPEEDVSWILSVDYPYGRVRLPVGNRIAIVDVADDSGSLLDSLGKSPTELAEHPLSQNYEKHYRFAQDQRRYSKSRGH